MPSQSVEAATREEAIAAAREEYGPSVKIVGVRRIRTGGVLGFFAAERYVAEVDLSALTSPAARAGGAATGRRAEHDGRPDLRRSDDAPRRGRPRATESVDDRMSELADLLGGAASAQAPVGLYSSNGVATGVAPTPAIEDVLAQRRPRTTASPRSGAPSPAPAARATASPVRDRAPRPESASRPVATASGATAAPPGRFAAAVQAAAAAPATPFTPSRYRPTLDRHVDPAAEPAEAPAPAGPSPFTAALARMVADRQVSVAVTDAVERSAALDAPADELVDPVFRVPAEEWVDEDEIVEPAAAPAPAPVVTAAAAAPVAAPAAPVMEVPQLDKRAALQSALQSALRSAQSTDPEMERLLEGVLDRVLAGETGGLAAPVETRAPASAAPPVQAHDDSTGTPIEEFLDELTSTGRHRFPEPAAADHPATREMAAVRVAGPHTADDALADDAPVGEALAVEAPAGEAPAVEELIELAGVTGSTTDQLDDELAGLVGQRSAADWASDWADDVRVRQDRVHELRREVVIDVRDNEVLAHREPLVMTPSMAAWPSMARTASDPAPLSMDHTTILPPLSLLPPQRMPSVGGHPPLLRGRPAVPPARRPLASGPSTASRPAISGRPAVPAPVRREGAERAALEVTAAPREVALAAAAAPGAGARLATVTRLVPAPPMAQLAGYGLSSGDELVVRLLALGLPEFLIAPGFARDAAVHGLYAALTRTLAERLAPLPEVPAEPGSVLLVVGPGPETLAAARSLAVSVRLDPAHVQWATPGDSATLAPEHSRITTLETATERHRSSEGAGTVTIVAVDAPLRTGGGTWLGHMLSIWGPDAVWGVVDATRKLEDVVPWLDGLPRLDAVVVQEMEATADPAAVLSHLTAPVARIDGARATAHRWASLLCERLEEMDS